jgi:hypothetical protein
VALVIPALFFLATRAPTHMTFVFLISHLLWLSRLHG